MGSQDDKFHAYLTYQESHSGGGVVAGDEDSEWPCYEDEYIEFIPGILLRSLPNKELWCETLDLDFDPAEVAKLHVVIVRYSTGCTFGRTNGCWQVVGAYKTREEAEAVEKSIDDKTYDGYTPWEGYFEYLENSYVETMYFED